MKTTTLLLILFLTGTALWAQTPPAPNEWGLMPRLPSLRSPSTNAPATIPPNLAARLAEMRSNTPALTAPAAALPSPGNPASTTVPATVSPDANVSSDSNSDTGTNEVPAYDFDFEGVDVNQVLKVYSDIVGRTLLRAQVSGTIILKTQSKLTKTEAIEALQAVLSLNGIEVINIGDKFVKVLPPDQAGTAGMKFDTSDASQLPELGTYVTHIVHLKYVKPSTIAPIIQPFSRLPNAVTALDDNNILVLRDNAENVKRMLELIKQVDVGGAASEIVSEVIPIKYALAEDIANALNSLGGSSTVSIGPEPTVAPTTSSLGARSGVNGIQTRTSTPTSGSVPATGSTFQSRLMSIVNRAAGTGGQNQQIEIFGQTKIIADRRSNSLLVFATRQDMMAITNVIGKLDVLLSQVLIESVIIDVDLNKAMNLGISAAQNPKVFSQKDGGIAGGGGMNNGPSFLNFLNSNSPSFSVGTNAANALASGFSYFGNIGPSWDLALQAAASDSSASVIQRPRIQTSQAKEASFKVGQTVPYVTGNTYGSAYGNSSSYSQLFVGVELDVTPFINPDGLVVMDIKQEIDDLNGSTYIQNVGNVPNTTTRSLDSEIAVKDRDTIILGGFIRSSKSNSRAGVPYLQDIPLIGPLFSQHTDSKDRQETIVLIRPTVLRTPDIAAAQAVAEQKRLPGITRAAAEDAEDERKRIKAEEKNLEKQTKLETGDNGGIFTPVLPDGTVLTNADEQTTP